MDVHIPRTLELIKAGWASRCPRLHIAAHGRDQRIADLNLQRVVQRYCAPLDRAGTLAQDLAGVGIRTEGEGSEIVVLLEDEAP